MTAEEIEFAKKALAAFLDNERDKGASEGLAYEVADSLLEEANEGGKGCLKNLPALKQAILNRCIEQEQQAQDDLEAESERGNRNDE